MKLTPAMTLSGSARQVLKAAGNHFVTQAFEYIDLSYDGVEGDHHAGLTRKSGAREPWYQRGTEMRNERQLSIVSQQELAEVAAAMGIDEIKPEWIGANLVLDGIDNLTYLPPRTILMFEGGVSIRIDGFNGPCKFSGAQIAKGVGVEAEDYTKTDLALSFVKAAQMKRGLVAWVEREGRIEAGESFKARVWPQWVYTG